MNLHLSNNLKKFFFLFTLFIFSLKSFHVHAQEIVINSAVESFEIIFEEPATDFDSSFASSAQSVLVDQKTILFQATLPKLTKGDDLNLYLFELQPFEYEISDSSTLLATSITTKTPEFVIPYTKDRLYTPLMLQQNQIRK